MNGKKLLTLTALLWVLTALSCSAAVFAADSPMGFSLQPLENLSGDQFDTGFYSMMIPHHDAAVEASQKILSATQNPQIKEWAQETIKTYAQQMQQMNQALYEESGGWTDQRLYRTVESALASQMKKINSDQTYIKAMIAHNNSTAAMAELAKTRTQNQKLLQLSQALVARQKQNNPRLQEWTAK